MRKFRIWLEPDIAGARFEDEVEVEDDATPKEIEDACKEIAFNNFDWGYEEMPDEKGDQTP